MKAIYGIISAVQLARAPVFGFVAIGLFWGAFAASIPAMKAQLGVNDAQFGMLLLCQAAGLVSAMFFAPRLDALLGPRGLQVSVAILAVLFVWPSLAPGPVPFGAAMLALGWGSGLLDVLINTRVSELEGQHKRPLMNACHGMFSVGYLIAAFGMGALRDGGGHPFWGFLILTIIVLGFTGFMRAVPWVDDDPEGDAAALPLWPVVLCGLVVLIAFMTEAVIEAWSALYIERDLGGQAGHGALGPAFLGITMAVGRFSGQALAERLPIFAVLFCATALAVIGAVGASVAGTPLSAAIAFGVMGLGISVIGPMGLALVGDRVRPSERGQAIARASIIAFSGFFIAPALMGMLAQFVGLRMAFFCVAWMLLLLVPLLLRLRR